MKKLAMVLAILSASAPAFAQFGGLGGAMKKAQQAQEAKQKIDDLTFTEQEEEAIGADVSMKVRQRFGVVQDPAVHKYVSLVGMTLAKASDRPDLPWTFIVLDTDGVNAFASPGGFVHITRGALGLIQNESELAGVLGHEIGHVVRKHTINAIRKNNAVSLGASATRSAIIANVSTAVYNNVLENAYDRGDEMDADRLGVELPNKVGYKPNALATFLKRLDDRNKDTAGTNGLFASHPATKERIDKINAQASSLKAAAVVEARYKSNIKYEAPPLTSIATVVDGSSGLAGSGKPAPEEKKEEPKPKGFGLGSLKKTAAPEKQSAQVSASGGARGLGADRAAKGGPNPAVVKTAVNANELAEFKKGIV